MPRFNLESVTAGDDCAIIQITGEVDVYTGPQLRERVVELIGDGFIHLIADLRDVEFLDSTGIGALVGSLRRVRVHDGSLMLVTSSARILEIFKITGLNHAFAMYPSISEAVETNPAWRAAVAKTDNPLFS